MPQTGQKLFTVNNATTMRLHSGIIKEGVIVSRPEVEDPRPWRDNMQLVTCTAQRTSGFTIQAISYKKIHDLYLRAMSKP